MRIYMIKAYLESATSPVFEAPSTSATDSVRDSMQLKVPRYHNFQFKTLQERSICTYDSPEQYERIRYSGQHMTLLLTNALFRYDFAGFTCIDLAHLTFLYNMAISSYFERCCTLLVSIFLKQMAYLLFLNTHVAS